MSGSSKPTQWEFIGIALLSAASLTFEISLTRLFSLQQFHHFAFVIISLALMGFAASGAMLSLWPNLLTFFQLGLAFSFAVALTYFTINVIPFDSYSIAWNPIQLVVLLLYFLCASLPFLFAGWSIGLGLSRFKAEAHQIYAASLSGSAIGCLLGLVALQIFGDLGTFALIAAMGLLAAALMARRRSSRSVSGLMITALLIFSWLAPETFSIQLSPYKPLAISLHAPEAEQTFSRWDLSGRVDIVESQGTHVFPGLSLSAPFDLPEQVALFIDGDGPHPLTRLDFEEPSSTEWAGSMPSAIAYQLRPQASSLLLRSGTGLELVVALEGGAEQVAVAQDHPLVFQVLRELYGDYSGNLLEQSRVEVIERTSRGALSSSTSKYDVVHFALSEPYRPIATGAFSLGEYYPLTVQSLQAALQSLNPGGLIVLTQWLSTPPIESARAWATALEALNRLGIRDPKDNLIAFRGMRTGTILISLEPFDQDELESVRDFLQEKSFDPISLPDLEMDELNRFNRLPEDRYHQVFSALLAAPESTIRDYPFNLDPPRDHWPYFYNFFRMQQTPAVVEQLGQVSLPFGGSGYLVLLVLLALLILLAVPIMLIPALAGHVAGAWDRSITRVMVFFSALGAGFLLVEIPLIQQFGLVFDQPATALGVVLFILLLASGVGSLLSPRVRLDQALLALAAYVTLVALTQNSFVSLIRPLPASWRLILVCTLIAPLGVLMGIPFVAGLRRITKRNPERVPWVWAINGAASGIFGVVAAMISLSSGFGLALLVGASTYLIALLAIPPDSPQNPG
jgi:hypothetical protein